MELKSIARLEKAGKGGRNESFRLGVGLIFVVMIMLYASLSLDVSGPLGINLVAAAIIGG